MSQPVTETFTPSSRARVPARERRDGEHDAREQAEPLSDPENAPLEEGIAAGVSADVAHRLHSMEHRADGVAALHFVGCHLR